MYVITSHPGLKLAVTTGVPGHFGKAWIMTLESQQACRVLLVDHDIEACHLMAEILTTHGCSVFCAPDAAAALALIPLHHPEVVFVDFAIDCLDGYQVAAQAKIWQMETALVVALTGRSDVATRLRVKRTGFDLHIVKPERLDVMLLAGSCRSGRAALMH